jgi:hypothetical protein
MNTYQVVYYECWLRPVGQGGYFLKLSKFGGGVNLIFFKIFAKLSSKYQRGTKGKILKLNLSSYFEG